MPEPQNIRVLKLAEGPISVVYKQQDGEWHCIALEFDLVGTGPTREKAFGSLKCILNLYLVEVLNTRGDIAFFNPADRADWDLNDKERYDVSVILVEQKATLATSKRWTRQEVRPLRKRIREFTLTPAGV